MNLSAFKAYDIRGKYPDEVNEQLAYLVGRATVKYLSAKIIVVGRDARLSSPKLSKKMIEGIISEGANVVDIGLCTTPMLNYSVANYGYDGGIMISASHNPGGDNAFKVIDGNVIQLDESQGLQEIKQMVRSDLGIAEKNCGSVTSKNVINDYVKHICSLIGPLKKLNIVADYGNGVGAVSAIPVFRSLGLKPKNLYAKPDGKFPNHPANPHDLVNFNKLIHKVTHSHADLGLFFDGDGDRLNVVDDLGRIVPIDLLTVLLAQEELLVKKSGNVYYDLRFSKAVPYIIKKAGGTPNMMRVGNPFYKRILRESGGVLGAEFAGHIMYPENFNIDDGLFAALKVVKMLERRQQKLSALIDGVTIYSASPEESIEAKNPSTVAMRLIAAFPEAKLIELDGTYLDFVDGFMSVRNSQNERQLFRIRVEAKTEAEMKSRFEKVKSIVAEG